MASIPLPKILQQKKESELETLIKQQTISIGKALSPVENPLKVKHARAAIISTFHGQGAHSFWAVSVRQPLLDNRITAWKFCHLLHKVLCEGHHLCCQQSMRHRAMLTEMGKLWGHLQDGYGACIKQYTKFLVTKIEFHERNPRIPANIALKRGELEKIGGDDINFYFHMAVEMFDYLDDILLLQDIIFKSLSTYHVNSMTSAGQCRVAPLIPCVQDASPLYDCLVRIMFKLHSHLPNDLLSGHRERFRTVFQQLRGFFDTSRNLQYFVNLIQVPKLPDSAPNFSSQVDFGEYQAPVVVMPEEVIEPDLVENLVDVNMATPQVTLPVEEVPVHRQPPPPPVDFEKLIHDRDDLIMHLQTEIDRYQKALRSTTLETRNQQAALEQQLATLNSDLSSANEELMTVRLQKQELELKVQAAPSLEQKAQEGEEKIKATEDKYQKLKTMYTQIRDEHVKLLRQHGEVSKQLAASTKLAADAVQDKEEIKCALEELQQSQKRAEESIQQRESGLSVEKDQLQQKICELEQSCREWQEKVEDLNANKCAQIALLDIDREKLEAEKKALTEELENIRNEKEDLVRCSEEQIVALKQSVEVTESDSKRALDDVLLHKHELETKLNEFELEMKNFQEKYEKLNEEKEETVAELQGKCNEQEYQLNGLREEVDTLKGDKVVWDEEKASLQAEIQQRSGELETCKGEIEEKAKEVETLNEKFNEMETKYTKLSETEERMQVERLDLENDVQDLLHQQTELEERNKAAQETIAALEGTMKESEIKYSVALRSLLETCIKSSERMATRAISENEFAGTIIGTPGYFRLVAEELQEVLSELSASHGEYVSDKNCAELFARKVILGGHLMATAHIQGISVCSTCADIECGEHIAEDLQNWCKDIQDLFVALHSDNDNDTQAVQGKVDEVKSKLQAISEKLGDMSKRLDTANVEDLFENEVSSMEKAIEEAANQIEKLLNESRATDSGLKLEVNEKILDACTNLMKAIRLLVQKSRVLQGEIVGVGKGTNTDKEFYKRNHQWTEGLISAAKAVAQGANFLVSAANKAVSGEAKHHLDVVVAAQEIAASTAQLVVASRVKAPKGSGNLQALATASKGVTQSTATVVATAKDCSRQLEDNQDRDLESLTVHQAKTMEMEIQVKVLELEQALQVERMRLAAFRRKNYQEK